MGALYMKVAIALCFAFAIRDSISKKIQCPVQCNCDNKNGVLSVSCTGHNVADINLPVPSMVQIYDLSNNSIINIENYHFQYMGLKLIRDLNLSNNKLSWIGLHALAGLNKLRKLDMSHNRLEHIPYDIFHYYNKELTYLDLSWNKFSSIPNEIFLSHSKLKVLKLGYSQISSLPDKVFSDLPSLEDLDLSGNYMTTLSTAVLSPLNKLDYIDLNNNQWTCNEHLKELEKWILEKNIHQIFPISIHCSYKNSDQQNMFEKMILAPNTDHEEREPIEDLYESDEISKEEENSDIGNDITTNDTFIDFYNEKVPSMVSLIGGLELGFILGMCLTYIWIVGCCKCKRIRMRSRRQLRREHNRRNNEAQDRLIWGPAMYSANVETPPVVRRQLSNPEAFCRSLSWEPGALFIPPTTVQSTVEETPATSSSNPRRSTTNRSETPPPPYKDCLDDTVVD